MSLRFRFWLMILAQVFSGGCVTWASLQIARIEQISFWWPFLFFTATWTMGAWLVCHLTRKR